MKRHNISFPKPRVGLPGQATADKRADLDLQISLLTEHELTKLATLVAAIAERLEVRTAADQELHEIEQDIAPEAVLDEIEATNPRQENRTG